MYKKILSLLVFSFLLLLILPQKTLAQTAPANLNLTFSPVFFDFTAAPGDTISDTIRVRTNGSNPLSLSILVKKLGPNPNGNVSIQDTSSDETIGWIQLTKTSVTASPDGWTNVPFTIKIPKTAAFGYYYAIAFDLQGNNKSNAKVTGEGAVPILLTVKKDGAKAEGQLVEFKTDSVLNEYLPVTFTTTIKSSGNIHIKPHGNIFIRGVGDKDIATLDVNQSNGAILPGSLRTFASSWDDGFIVSEPQIVDGRPVTDANGKAVTHLAFHWDRLTSIRIGKYSANLLVVYDNGTRDVVVEGTTSFWVLPYKPLAVFIVGLILIIFLIRFFLRWYIKKELRKSRRR